MSFAKKVTIGAVGWKPREEDGRFFLCFYKRVPRRVHRGVTQTAASDGRARSGITHLCTASSRRWFMGAGCLKPRVTLMASDAEHLFLFVGQVGSYFPAQCLVFAEISQFFLWWSKAQASPVSSEPVALLP